MRKALPVASTTLRELLASPFPWIVMGATSLLMALSTVLPSFTLEESGDLKFMMDVSLSGIAVALLLVGIWPAATLVSDEFSQRTALTLLAKPLSRGDYLFGRYLGILGGLVCTWTVLSGVFLGCAWLTESQALNAPLDAWLQELTYGIEAQPEEANERSIPLRWNLLPACALTLGQAALLTAVATALSVGMGTLPVLGAAGLVYVLGHASGALDPAGWTGLLLRTLLPQLSFFTPSEAVARGTLIPAGHALGCLAYASGYSAAALLAALPFFERREIV